MQLINSQKGISITVGVIIAVLVIAVIGGGIYLVLSQQQQPAAPPPAVTEEPKVQEPTTDETADWKVYRNEKYGFEVRYPGEWGELDFRISPGESGMAFSGSFTNSGARFRFYTMDWSRPIGTGPIFRSYTKNVDGTYNYQLRVDSVRFKATKVITHIDGGEVLIVGGQDAADLTKNLIGEVPLPVNSFRRAYINFEKTVDGDSIKGFLFSYIEDNYHEISKSSEEMFDTFVSTFKIL